MAASTWPVPVLMTDHLITDIDHADVQSTLWLFPAFSKSILAGQSPFLQDGLAWPVGQDTRLLVWNYALALLLLPVTLLVDAPILRMNLSGLLIAAVNGLVAAAAGRRLGGTVGAWAAMIIAAGSYYAFQEAGTGRMEQGFWAPLVGYLCSLWSLQQSPGDRRMRMLGAACLALTGAVYWFYAYFLVVISLAVGAVWLVRRRLALLWDLVWVGLGSLLLVSPFLIPVVLGQLSAPDFFGQMATAAGDSRMAQVGSSLPLPGGFLGPVPGLGALSVPPAPLLMVPLCLAALATARLRLLGAIGLVASVLAAGPVLLAEAGQPLILGSSRFALPHRLLDVLPGFSRLWWPYRWQAVGLAASTLCAAGLLGGLRRGWLALPPLAGWVLLEGHAMLHGGVPPTQPPVRMATVPAVFTDIGQLDGTHPIIGFPTTSLPNSMMGFVSWHGQPIAGGMAWSRAEVHSDASRARDATVPLLAALHTLEQTDRLPALPTPLTEEDTGGFRFLVLYQQGARRKRRHYEAVLSEALGDPVARERMVTVWALPGAPPLP